MNSAIRVEHQISAPIAVVRRWVAPRSLSSTIPAACGLVWQTLKAAQVTDAGRHVVVYHGAEGGLIDTEIGVEVMTAFAGRDELAGSSTPAGDAATMTYFGPYGKLVEAHQAILQWCAAHGLILAGASWEIYSHWQGEWNDDPSKIRSDVFYLLKG